jgi:hypothetical protein
MWGHFECPLFSDLAVITSFLNIQLNETVTAQHSVFISKVMDIFLFFVNKFECRYSISFQKIIHISITGLLIMTSAL